jgi:hypothetical protein
MAGGSITQEGADATHHALRCAGRIWHTIIIRWNLLCAHTDAQLHLSRNLKFERCTKFQRDPAVRFLLPCSKRRLYAVPRKYCAGRQR